jgi:hypothetical protein
MLDGIQPRAFGKHPAGEDALNFSVQLHLINLNKRRCVRRLGRRPGIADARGDFERAELHGLADRNFEMRDAAGDLIERRKHGDRVLDLVGQSLPGTEI